MHTTTLTPAAAAGADPKGTKPTIRRPAPPELADLALIDAPRIAAAACMSLSSWHELVRTGQAPPPAWRAPRCTRWRLADVREWLRQRADKADAAASETTMRTARKASAAASAKRTACTSAGA